MVAPKPSIFRRYIQPQQLGQRLAFYFISICILFSVITTLALSYKQYHEEKASIYQEGQKTINAIKEQLARSLWNVDQDSTRILLEGMYRMPSIKSLKITETLGNTYEYGSVQGDPSFKTDLIFNDQNMGSLEIEIDEELITEAVLPQSQTILLSSAIMIGLIGLVFSYIVRKSVTRHLSKISEITSDPERFTDKAYKPIELDRPFHKDELTDLVNALNEGQRQVIEFTLARESYENQLEYQANFDVLTRLPNRRHIDNHLRNEMDDYQSGGKTSKLAMFFIDLDGFKEVNDSLGHSVGDKILQDSANRLRALIEKYHGYVARFGGDEFIASFHCLSRSEVEKVAEETILTFKDSFILNESQIQLGCSIGVVMYPDDGETTEELIRKADTAMYKAKADGRNTFAFFDQLMMHDIVLNNTIKNKLKDAIANEELELHFQPLINLKDMSICGFEALLRWEDPDLGRVSPDQFIPVAEKTGLIFDIDVWVFEQAIQQVKAWRKEFDIPYIVSINFSPTNFHHRQLNHWVREHNVFSQPLDWVELEVTERLVLDDDPIVLRGIEKLLKAGLKFSIDDFGTGYSSLGYIKKFSHILSKIKVDRLFVNELINSASDRALVKSIITLAESLSIEVLAEGIETQDQEEVLVDLGCDYAQGYFYAKPLPVSEIPDFIRNWKHTPSATIEINAS